MNLAGADHRDLLARQQKIKLQRTYIDAPSERGENIAVRSSHGYGLITGGVGHRRPAGHSPGCMGAVSRPRQEC